MLPSGAWGERVQETYSFGFSGRYQKIKPPTNVIILTIRFSLANNFEMELKILKPRSVIIKSAVDQKDTAKKPQAH